MLSPAEYYMIFGIRNNRYTYSNVPTHCRIVHVYSIHVRNRYLAEYPCQNVKTVHFSSGSLSRIDLEPSNFAYDNCSVDKKINTV
jgi:hypothetical protein